MPAPVSGSLNAVANGAVFVPAVNNGQGNFNVAVNVAANSVLSYVIQRSIDQGTNWVTVTNGGVAPSFTSSISEIYPEIQGGVQYRVAIVAYTSGSLSYQFSQ